MFALCWTCSDGTGRTGTYILIDMVLNRMAKGDTFICPLRFFQTFSCPSYRWTKPSICVLQAWRRSISLRRWSTSGIRGPAWFALRLLEWNDEDTLSGCSVGKREISNNTFAHQTNKSLEGRYNRSPTPKNYNDKTKLLILYFTLSSCFLSFFVQWV